MHKKNPMEKGNIFQSVVLEKCISISEINEFQLLTSATHQNPFEIHQKPKCKPKTLILIEENIGK
jgi:hypothetical protein